VRLQGDADEDDSRRRRPLKRPRFLPGSVRIVAAAEALPLRRVPDRIDDSKATSER
jgi:hypothetical protein